ncbi:MAG: hypothetical protein AAGG55_02900 [Pseudomonadota bacterium]
MIKIFNGEQQFWDYFPIYPDGKGPALSIDGEVITEKFSTPLYLASQSPDARLDPFADTPRASEQAIE